MQAPSTVVQLVLLVLLVLPGITYQFVRERLRGPVPRERDLGERVLRAVVTSIALDAAYLTVAGPALIKLTRGTPPGDLNGFVQQPRAVGLVAVLLFLVVPGAAAFVVSLVQRKRRKSTFQRTPTAWTTPSATERWTRASDCTKRPWTPRRTATRSGHGGWPIWAAC